MKDYTKQIDKEREKLEKLTNKLEEFKVQSANKIAEMTAEIKQQKEALNNVIELDKQEKLAEIARLMSSKGADVNMLFNAVQSGDLYGIQEIFEKGMKPEQEIPESNESETDEDDETVNLAFSDSE